MRRIGLIISSLMAAGLLLASTAHACPSKAQEPKKLQLDTSKKPARLFTPATATKQGKLDDRLIRPHHSYDASAGVAG